MTKTLLAVFSLGLLLTGMLPLHALLSDYTFSQSSNTYTEITGGILLGDEATDDQRFLNPAVPLGTTTAPYKGPGFPIGFNFIFNNHVFDVIAINANGWISFGQSALGDTAVDNTSTSINAPLPSTVTTNPPQLHHRVAGFARDLTAQTGASLRIETIGSQPNRICIIQWKNYKRWGTAGVGDTINFQIQLHENMNKVVFTYGVFRHGPTPATTYYPQVGMRGIEVTDFANRTTTTNWATTTAGTANTANCVFSTTCMPPRGLTFEYYYQPVYETDLQALSLAGNQSPYVGNPTPYTVTVRNNGTSPQSDYTVKLMSGTQELASVAGPPLALDSTAQVVLNWTPTAVGTFQLSGLVSLTGDQYIQNNQTPNLNVGVISVVYGTLVGTVKRINNLPIFGATITAGSYSTTSYASGNYTMQVAAGTYAVTCSAPGFITQTTENVVISEGQSTICNFILGAVANEDEIEVLTTTLGGNYPNPFSSETTLSYTLKEPARVSLGIYNLKGQLIRTLVQENKAAGHYTAIWDGKDDQGKAVYSGVYHCHMQAGSYCASRRLLLLK